MHIHAAELKHKKALFGSSGIRRLFGADLIQLALKAGATIGKEYHNVVVGCDTRTSSEVMKHSLIAGLIATGAKVCDIGYVPTPTLAFMAKNFDAAAMITASHNPPEYNGIKLLNPDGSAFDASQRQDVEIGIESDSLDTSLWFNILRESQYREAINSHIDYILGYFPGKYDLKVVVDAGCGAAYQATPHLLNRMGCKVITMNCHSTGIFPRPVEPTKENLTELVRTVSGLGADLGIAHDGDADRMMAVDDRGRFIPGDTLLAIFALESEAKKIVTTIDASMIVEEIGLDVMRTKIGDIYVSEQLKCDGDWGGEPSGSWVFPQQSLCPDGIYAAAAITAIASQKRLSSLFDQIPAYPIRRGSIRNDGINMKELEERLLLNYNPLSISKVDGLKLQFDDAWLLVRPSGTEQKIRLTVEAHSEKRTEELYSGAISILKEF